MIGNDNEALLSAARVGLGILARGDCLMMQGACQIFSVPRP
ncbi:hypothetical protein [Burkholderia cenocepacia]|nr:hypothetical protein [Burkholderia cenocepacia]